MSLPEITIVVAMTREGVIGDKGLLPWRIPEDLRLFRELTTGHTVIMGRGTFASIGHPLPGRRNIVVSRSLSALAGVEVCGSFAEALERGSVDGRKVFVIGGRSLYRHALPVADSMVVSWVREIFAGDTYFPPFDEECWSVVRKEEYAAFTRIWYEREATRKDLYASGDEMKEESWPT